MLIPTEAMIWAFASWVALRSPTWIERPWKPTAHIDAVDESDPEAIAPATAATAAMASRGADMAAAIAVLADMARSSSGGLSGEGDGERGQRVLAMIRSPGQVLFGYCEREVRQSVDRSPQGGAYFHPCERGAEAVVGTVTEAEVAAVSPIEVDLLRVGDVLRIAVG
jgi:hypothetical protein